MMDEGQRKSSALQLIENVSEMFAAMKQSETCMDVLEQRYFI